MLNSAILDDPGWQELISLATGRDVLYLHPGSGSGVLAVADVASCVWNVGPALSRQGESEPTHAAELVYALESSAHNVYRRITTVLGDPVETLPALFGRRFDLVVIDWCDAAEFSFSLLLYASAMAPRVAITGYGTQPRGTVIHRMFHGTGWLFYPAGTLGVLTSPVCPTHRDAEVY